MKSKKAKERKITGAELEELRHLWNATQQAKMMHRATWELWERAGGTVAKRFRIPRNKFHIDLRTGEVTRLG